MGIPRKMSNVFLHLKLCIILLYDLQLCYLYQASVDTGVVYVQLMTVAAHITEDGLAAYSRDQIKN